MINDEDRRKQDLVDSLLRSLYETDKERSRSLVSAGMKRIDEDSIVQRAKRPPNVSFGRLPRWLSVAAAAAALIAIVLSLPLFDSTQRATAAVTRSIEQAIKDVGRHYHVNLNVRFPDQGAQNYDAELYVKGGQRFAIRVYGPVQKVRPFWLGSNAENSWVVPPVGPILEGQRRSLNQWAKNREELATPYLHISTALELMRDKYELIALPTESLEINGRDIRCTRVRGQRKGESSQEAPDQFELWADSKTGVAMKVVASWDLAKGQSGRESILIQFEEEKELTDEFFTPQVHGGRTRNTIDFFEELR